MLPTIKQIREANGGLSNLTDFEIAQHQHQRYQQYYPDFGEFAKDMGVDTGTKWGNRLSASVDNYQAGLSGVAEEVTGSTTMRNWREDNERLARNSQQFAASQGAIMSTKDVESVGDVPELIGGWAIDSAPYLLESAVGGLAVRGLSTGLRGTMAAGRAADASLDAIRAGQAARKAMAVRTTAGGVLASYPSAVGDILQNQRDEAGETNLGSAALGGIGYAGLNALGLEGAAARGGLGRGINLLDEGLDGVKGLRGAALRTGADATRVGTVEGLSETGQEMINQSFGRMAVNPDQTMFNPEANDRYQESFIAGFGLGGTLSAATGGWRRSEGYQAPIDANGGVNLLNGQPLNPPAQGLQLGYDPTAGNDRLITFPDGTTAFPEDVPERRAQLAAQDHPGFVERTAEYPEVPLVSLEQAALAEDKAKIEARSAVREEAKGLGITGSKGADLYLELKQALEDGVISEADFRETRVQLGERKNNQVAKFLKAAYAQAETTQAAKAEREAGALAAVQNPTAQASTMSQEEADAMVAEWTRLTGQQGDVTNTQTPAAQQGDVTDVQAREVQPVAGAQTPARRNWSDAPGAVAGIAPDKTVEVGRSGRKKALTPAQVLEKIKKASPLNKMRILAATGMDMVADPTTGAPKLVISGNPMTLDEIADAESEATGKKVSKQAISQALADAGIDADVATQVASTDSGTVYTEADLGITPTDEGVADASGFRIEDTASKATNQGVIYDEVSGNAHLNKIADLLLKGKITPEQVAQVTRYKSAAVQPNRAGINTSTPVMLEQTAPTESKTATKSDTVVTDMRDLTDATIEQNIRDILDGHPERDNATADWGSTKVPWDTLPDTFRADWIEQYGEIVDRFDGDLNQAAFRLIDAIQANIEDSYSDYIKYKGQQAPAGASPEALPGGESRVGMVAGAEEARPAVRDEGPAQAGRVEGQAAEPVENTSAKDQRVAQENAAKAKVVVKKKRTIQKPVEAEVREATPAPVVEAAPATRFSKGGANSKVTPTGAKTGNTVSQVKDAVNALFPLRVRDLAYQDRVKVHQTEADAVAAVGGKISADEMVGAQGFVDPTDDRIIHLVADNLPKGRELGVLLHEVGVHVGLAKKFKGAFKVLADQVQSWADAPRGSLERRVYEAAKARVDNANPDAAERSEELVAYAAEEAVSEGVMPNAQGVNERMAKWVQNALSYMRNMVREFLGFQPAVTLTPQDLVDFAYGAARATLGEPIVERAAMSGEPVTSEQLLDYYTKGKGYESDAAVYEDALPGTGVVRWGANSYYGPHVGKTTYAYVASAGAGSRAGEVSGAPEAEDLIPHEGTGIQTFGMVLTAQEAETEALARNDDGEATLLTIDAWHTGDGVWEVGVFGPDRDTDLFKRLVDRGQAKLLPPDEDGHQWTALTGIGDGETRALLTEFRRRLTRALNGEVPHIIFTRATGAAIGKESDYAPATVRRMFSKAAPSVAQQLGPQYAKPETALTRAIGDLKTAAIKYGAFTRDLIDQAAKLMPAARKYLEHYEAVATDRTRMEQQVDAVLERFAALNTHERTRVNEVIRTSTMSKEWAFKPDWLPNAKYDENSDVARAFRALTPAQRGVIQDVFRHGHDTLAAMQKAVKDNVNSEFDVLIKGFRDAGNMDEATKAEARKAKALTEFSSMLEMNGNWPYAPLRRFGDHVVVAKSAAYRAAERADDKAQIKALEADENHYYVEFFESRGDARKAVDNMQATGKYDQVENFNKGNANEQLYGGRDVFNAFRRLRGLVNETGGASLSEPADATINKLMNDLYLSLLGERSARQAERNRKNTAGADRDMMRAFATKGRADAHFIASLRFGGQVQEDLLKMKKEADEGPNGGTRELRREYFNEILARHTMQMDFQSTPVVDKVMATSSFWQLLFNPAYYLQNVMQPWVMSLPMLAGKHGYGKSWSALARAYRDLGPLIKDGAFTKGDYDALPADVRAIVKDLAARGRIEITLEHDLGQWNSNVDDKAYNRAFTWVTKGLRGVNSRLEMLNRLATGIAAARLEGVGNAKNATDYADRVIIGTHGDYNAFNAPRLMRTPLGRMATQFRKFQLIQITMYTKLVSDALKGASPTERAVARRVLAYNLGHMAVLGGAMGLPGFQLFSMVLGSIFGDDDEPDDAEATLRRVMGNGPLTDALTRGVPNMLGVDLSGKVGSGTMLSLFPYADWNIESRSGYQNLLAAAAGPFVGGLMPKWADAVGTAKQGDYYKALEKVLPGALGNAIKGTRFAVDGVTTTRGVQAMSADEITWVDGLFQAVGLPTSTITDRNFRSGAEYKASKFFDEKVSQVKKDYVEAFQDNDTDAMAEARQEWLDMQATRKRLGLTVQPLSQLIKAPRERMKRDRMAVGGVAADKETQGFVKNLME